MNRRIIHLGGGFMAGFSAALLALALSTAGQGPEPSLPLVSAKPWNAVVVNGYSVPIAGEREGDRLIWHVEEQSWSVAPTDGDAFPDELMAWFGVTINHYPAMVRGWYVGDHREFVWRWADQKRHLAKADEPKVGDGKAKPKADAPGKINPAGALANGVEAGKLDGRGTVRASDAATEREARAVMEAGKPAEGPCEPSRPKSPDRIKPPALPGSSGLDWGLAGRLAAAGALGLVGVGCVLGLIFGPRKGGGS